MILTITPNAALDRIFFIDEWTPGLPMRIDKMVTAVGGKALDASVSLACQGVHSTAVTFVAGRIGRELLELLSGYDVRVYPVWVEGETRVAHVVAEKVAQHHTHLIAGNMIINDSHVQTLFKLLLPLLKQASWLVSGGSLPAGMDTRFFAQVLEMANQAGVSSLIDTSAVPIKPILDVRPTILKINQVEFENAFALPVPTIDALLSAGQRVMAAHKLPNLIITCGAQGLYALTASGIYHAQAPLQVVVNAAGAGDAIAGTLPYRLAQGDSWMEALRQATAVSAATVLTEKTAECRPEDVTRILPLVEVTRLS